MASNWGAQAPIAPTVEGAYGHAWQVMASRFWLLIGLFLATIASIVLLWLLFAAILSPVLVLACLTGVGAALTSAAAGQGSDEQAAAAALAAVGLGLLAALFLCAIPMIWVSSRLLFTQVLVSDEGRGPIEAIQRSWAMTRGHALTIILVMLLSIPIALAGLLAFCVGVIPATTWILLAIASMYVALGGGPQQQGSAPPAPLQPPQPPQG